MNMKPPEILSLLEEASGTKMYERKKDSAMSTLAKKQTRLEEIDEVSGAPKCPLMQCVGVYVLDRHVGVGVHVLDTSPAGVVATKPPKHPLLTVCVVMWGGRSFGLHTSKVRAKDRGHTYSLHRTHMGCLTWTVRAHVL
jgi:hypothetical protein